MKKIPYNNIKLFHSKAKSAFTLIEVMVSVALFLVVMVIVLGALLSIIDGNKKTLAINSVSNNLSSAIESMVRDLKTGFKYTCDMSVQTIIVGNEIPNCTPSSPERIMSFMSTISGSPRAVQYWLSDPDANGRKGIMKYYCPSNVTDCSNPANYETLIITSTDVDIKTLDFYASVPDKGVDQPGIFIVIKGTAYINKTQISDFSIQTFVSQRLLNI